MPKLVKIVDDSGSRNKTIYEYGDLTFRSEPLEHTVTLERTCAATGQSPYEQLELQIFSIGVPFLTVCLLLLAISIILLIYIVDSYIRILILVNKKRYRAKVLKRVGTTFAEDPDELEKQKATETHGTSENKTTASEAARKKMSRTPTPEEQAFLDNATFAGIPPKAPGAEAQLEEATAIGSTQREVPVPTQKEQEVSRRVVTKEEPSVAVNVTAERPTTDVPIPTMGPTCEAQLDDF